MSRLTRHQEKALADTPAHDYDSRVVVRWSRLTMQRLKELGYVERQQQEPSLFQRHVPAYRRTEKGTAYFANKLKRARSKNARIKRRRNGR